MKKKLHQPSDEHMDESWLIPYADLLTLLLALFIVLFAASEIDAEKYEKIKTSFNQALNGGDGVLQQPNNQIFKQPDRESSDADSRNREQERKEISELTNLKKSIDEYIGKNQLTDKIETRLDGNQLAILIYDRAMFDSGSAQLKPEAKIIARTISEMLALYPGYQIVVTGHTDNVPIANHEFESNWELSAKRAIHFMEGLLENSGLDAKRFSAVGQGEYRPIASNETPEGKARNRRVEISVLRSVND